MAQVHLQSLIVMGSGEPEILPPEPQGLQRNSASTNVGFVIVIGRGESHVLRKSLSSVPVISRSELMQEYQDVSNALAAMSELDDDLGRIDPPVLTVAQNVAADLALHNFPAPKIFSHGSKSVVFNWSQSGDNLYLTISADKLSALISSPARIQKRVDFEANKLISPTLLLTSMRWGKPIAESRRSDPAPEPVSIGQP
jgi:hypothetical protein